MRRLFYGFAVLLACVPAARLHAGTVDQPDTLRLHAVETMPVKTGGARVSIAVPAWTLERMIQETIADNPQVLSKRAANQSAREGVAAARLKFLPSPYVQLQQKSGEMLSSSYKRYEVYGVQQPIWGLELFANLSVAKSTALSSSLSVQETRLALAQSVVNVYQNLLAYHNRIRAQENGVRLIERYAGMMDRRVNAGVSAPIDKVQVNARLFQARNELYSYRSAYRVALEQMTQLVGKPLKDQPVVFLTNAGMEMPPGSDFVLARAEALNPVLARMAADIEVAKHQRKLQTAALLPTVSLKAEHRNYRDVKDFNTHENVVYAAVDYSFGSGLPSVANIRSATARIESYAEAREATRRDVRAKIQADSEECLQALMRYQEASLSTRASASVLESYTRMFVAGKRSWLDVLNAARELIQSEVAEGDILAAYWGSRYRLRLDAMDDALIAAD